MYKAQYDRSKTGGTVNYTFCDNGTLRSSTNSGSNNQTSSDENTQTNYQSDNSNQNSSRTNQSYSSQSINSSNPQSDLAKVEQKIKEQNIESQRQSVINQQQAFQQIDNLSSQIMNTASMISNSRASENTNKYKEKEILKLNENIPEFKTINTPDDYQQVTITYNKDYNNLLKTGTIEIEKWAKSIFEEMATVKQRSYQRLKVEAAFQGANTVNIKILDIGYTRRGISNIAKVDIYANAFSDNAVDINGFNTLINDKRIFKTENMFTFDYSLILDYDNSNYKKKELKKDINIISISQETENKPVIIKATIGSDKKEYNFNLVSFTNEQFVIMRKEDERQEVKYISYLVKIEK